MALRRRTLKGMYGFHLEKSVRASIRPRASTSSCVPFESLSNISFIFFITFFQLALKNTAYKYMTLSAFRIISYLSPAQLIS